jgi:hypothetical protein
VTRLTGYVPCVKGFGIALVALVALACGCSTPSTTKSTPSTSKPSSASTSNPQTQFTEPVAGGVLAHAFACPLIFAPGDSQPDAALVGKSLAAAKVLASRSNQTLRIVAQNGACNGTFSDLVWNRLDLWIVNDRVIKAVLETLPEVPTTS